MEPVEMMRYLIGNSTKEGDNVLGLFGGSGSTLIACEELNRICYTMELEPKYCEVIIERWETLTGEKAALLFN
jgi:site-specific DNA-methyltransferase (adenine-specific)